MTRTVVAGVLTRLLKFVGLVAAHGTVSFATLWCCAFQTGPGVLLFGFMFLPTILLLQLTEDPHHMPELGALVGIPDDGPLAMVLFLAINSLLWVGCAYGLWLAGRWAYRKVVRARG
jgi:hypothetical protein